MSRLGYSTAISTFALGAIFNSDPDRDGVFYLLMVLVTLAAAGAALAAAPLFHSVDEWGERMDATKLIDGYTRPLTVEAMHELAHHYEKWRDANEHILDHKRLQLRRATIAAASLPVTVVATWWIVG